MTSQPLHFQMVTRNLLLLGVSSLAAFAIACTSSRDTPLITEQDLGTPTPTPTVSPTPLPNVTAQVNTTAPTPEPLTPLDVIGKDVIKIANWQDKAIQLENNLIGYFMVWGYGYTVELIDVGQQNVQSAIEKGEVDLVLEVDTKDTDQEVWFKGIVESGAVVDAGTLFEEKPGVRIAVHSSMRERAPDLVEFLGNLTPGDQNITDIAKNVTFGRIGLRPNAAAIKYLKDHEDVWTAWASPDVVVDVKTAVEAGKTSLRNRTCIPRGVEANDCGRN